MTDLAEITVTANGSVSEMPDGIRIGMSVVAQKLDYAQTLNDLNQMVAAINLALEKAEVLEPATTQSYDVSEIWSDPYDEDKRKLQGYRGKQKMAVSIGLDNSLLGRIVAGLAACKGNPSVDITFIVQNTDKLEQMARLKAVKRARESANDLANAAGLKLVSVKSISFSSNQKSLSAGLHLSDLNQFDVPSAPSVKPYAISHNESVKMIWLAELF